MNNTKQNTNLYGKAVFFILKNQSFDSVPSASIPSRNSKEEQSSFTLFRSLERDQPSNCFFRKLSLTKPNTYLARILTFMTGSNPSVFEVGSRIPYPSSAIEDSILYQMTQSGLKTLGFVNESWDAVYQDLFTQKEDFQEEEEDQANNPQQQGRYSNIVNKLKSNSFDLVIVSDSISSFKDTPNKTAVEQIEEQLITIFDAMDDDTIFFAISDGPHYESSDKFDFPNSASSFIFAYTKGGFSPYSSFIEEIEREVAFTADDNADGNNSETIQENRIAATLASIFGIAIPFSSSGRIIFDIYPGRISEQQFQQRVLQDAYINMMQQFELLKKSNVKSLTIREVAGRAEEARLKISKQSIDGTQITDLLQEIILTSELMSKTLQNQPLPYSLPVIYLGLLASGVAVISLVILLLIPSIKKVNNQHDGANVTEENQDNKDSWQKFWQQPVIFGTMQTMFRRWISNFNESSQFAFVKSLFCLHSIEFAGVLSIMMCMWGQTSIKTYIFLIIFFLFFSFDIELFRINSFQQYPLMISIYSFSLAVFYFLFRTFIFSNRKILSFLQTLSATVFFILIGLQGNKDVNLLSFTEKPEIFYGSLFAVNVILTMMDWKSGRSLGSSLSEVIIICMGIAAIQPSNAVFFVNMTFWFLIWTAFQCLNKNQGFVPIRAFQILFILLEPQTVLTKNKSPIIWYLENIFGFSLNSSTMIASMLTTILVSILVVHLLKFSLHFSQNQPSSSTTSSSISGAFTSLKQLASQENVQFSDYHSMFLPFLVLLSISLLEFQISFCLSYQSVIFDLNMSTHSQFIDFQIVSLIAVSITCVTISSAVKPSVKLDPSQNNKISKHPYEMLDETPSKIIDSEQVIKMNGSTHQGS